MSKDDSNFPGEFAKVGMFITLVMLFLLSACKSPQQNGLSMTTSSPGFEKAEKEPGRYTPIGSSPAPFYTHQVGQGTLIETNFSPLNSRYRVMNVWKVSLNGLNTNVFAGGRWSEPVVENYFNIDTFWTGAVVVQVSDGQGNFYPKKSGEFLTPKNHGPIRILDEKNNLLTLVARDGSLFTFDLTHLEFLANSAETPLTRPLGDGVLIESGTPPFTMTGYFWMNKFLLTGEDVHQHYYLAGRLKNDPHQGVLMILTESEKVAGLWEGVAFQPPDQGGALRIVAGDAHQLVIVSEEGVVFSYDLVADKFTFTSEGDTIASVPIVLSPAIETEITPTITPTPGSTRTALPTKVPYP